jgi:chromosome segregation ATPase
VPVDESQPNELSGRSKWPYFVLGLVVLALVGAGWAAYTAYENGKAADRWQQRAIEYEEQVNGLRTLIGERSAQLNDRTRQANALASNLRSTRNKLRRSEGDVSSLSRRQRELANEKAQLQDERRSLQQQAGMLTEIASRYIDCKSSLIDVINSLIDEDYSTASYEIRLAQSYCDSASSALETYVNAYP